MIFGCGTYNYNILNYPACVLDGIAVVGAVSAAVVALAIIVFREACKAENEPRAQMRGVINPRMEIRNGYWRRIAGRDEKKS